MKVKKENRKAVIYCRVSSTKQTVEGDGLNSQQTRCREYAKYKGYTITEVFMDDISGGVVERPGMQTMLRYLKQHRAEDCAVIIDDISRLARGVQAHFELRKTILDAGGRLESPSIEFGEDADSIMVETMLATISQHQRQKNAEQVVHRMRARNMNGYWTSRSPKGYKYKETRGEGKVLVFDEPVASIVQEALEGFAHERFETQAEVKRFLESQPLFPKDLPNGELRRQTVTRILKKPLYAGYLEVPNWSVSLRKARHPGLIDFSTYQKIQERLAGKAKAPARKDLNEDFPLRGFVTCGDCDRPLKSCWSKGKYKHYAYYLCQTESCDSYGKSIPKDTLEGDFETILNTLKPTETLFKHVKALFIDVRDQHRSQSKTAAASLKTELSKIDKQIEQLLDRIVEAASRSVISAYEKRIDSLETKKLILAEKLTEKPMQQGTYDQILEPAMGFLSNPCNLWNSDRFENKRAVLKLAFTERLAYVRNQGYRTPKIALPFALLNQVNGMEKQLKNSGNKGFQGESLPVAPSNNEGTFDPAISQFGMMVRTGGLEPPRSYLLKIFVPLRLSPPPSGVRGLDYTFTIAIALGAVRLVSTPSRWIGLGSGSPVERFPRI